MSRTSVELWRDGRLRERSRGGDLLFGRMFEDVEIERSLFPPGGRILCIGSAGCTALALAGDAARVVAVDVNPRQIEYIRRRLAGGDAEEGRVDRLLAAARKGYAIAGIREADLRRFLMMEDPTAQVAVWRERIYSPRARLVLDLLLGPLSLGILYAPRYRGSVPLPFSRTIASRLERGFAIHPNRSNRYIWRLLLGIEPPGLSPIEVCSGIETVCADIVDYLRRAPAGSFDGFSLSNILDGATETFASDLLEQIARVGSVGAPALIRSIGEPRSERERAMAARDRSMIWGSVRVE